MSEITKMSNEMKNLVDNKIEAVRKRLDTAWMASGAALMIVVGIILFVWGI